MGFTTLRGGRILLDGNSIERIVPFQRNRRGLGFVPQEREIFASLSVEENLAIAQRNMKIEDLYKVAGLVTVVTGGAA
eukprot:gene37328-44752_t